MDTEKWNPRIPAETFYLLKVDSAGRNNPIEILESDHEAVNNHALVLQYSCMNKKARTIRTDLSTSTFDDIADGVGKKPSIIRLQSYYIEISCNSSFGIMVLKIDCFSTRVTSDSISEV